MCLKDSLAVYHTLQETRCLVELTMGDITLCLEDYQLQKRNEYKRLVAKNKLSRLASLPNTKTIDIRQFVSVFTGPPCNIKGIQVLTRSIYGEQQSTKRELISKSVNQLAVSICTISSFNAVAQDMRMITGSGQADANCHALLCPQTLHDSHHFKFARFQASCPPSVTMFRTVCPSFPLSTSQQVGETFREF